MNQLYQMYQMYQILSDVSNFAYNYLYLVIQHNQEATKEVSIMKSLLELIKENNLNIKIYRLKVLRLP